MIMPTQTKAQSASQSFRVGPAMGQFFGPIIAAMRSTSIALVPYLIVLASLILINALANNDVLPQHYTAELGVARQLLWEMYPLIVMLFFAAQYATYLSVNRVVGASLCLVSVVFFNAFAHGIGWQGFLKTSVLQILLIPVLNIQVARFIHTGMKLKNLSKLKDSLSQEITDSFSFIAPFILTVVLSGLILLALDPLFNWIRDQMQSAFLALGNDGFLFVRMIAIHALWSVGLHGSNTFDIFLNSGGGSGLLTASPTGGPPSTVLSQHIDFNFYNLFVLHGGAGSALALCIALIFGSVDKHAKRIALISFPFAIFNISEILIFGLPIIFNRLLLIPFFIVPIVNYGIGYLVFSSGMLQFSYMTPPWTTPVFINSSLAGQGSWVGPATQLIQLAVGTMIYWYFVKKYTTEQSSAGKMRRLISTLNLPDEISKIGDGGFYRAQKKIIKAHTEVNDVIILLQNHSPELYYQPKVLAATGKSDRFEALLRIRISATEVRGPFFLNTLEDASFASVIDLWVCDAVKRDIDKWRSLKLDPLISINLHPDTIVNTEIIRFIAKSLAGYRIDFEVIERGDVSSDAVVQNIKYLRGCGYSIALDDFGSGYSGFGVINAVPLDSIKIDKSLLDAADQVAGREVFKASIDLCKQLHISSVAEGVETAAQMAFAIECGIDYIQGYYTGRPMPSDGVVNLLQKNQMAMTDRKSVE